MKSLLIIMYLTALFLFQSCSSTSTNSHYTSSKRYQKRAEFKKDYLNNEGKNLSSEQISNLLSKKVNLKRPLKMAVVKLIHQNDIYSNDITYSEIKFQQTIMTNETAKHFKYIVEKSNYIKDVSLIPDFIMPKEDDFKSLRDVAALMQADLLLILQTKRYTDYDFNLTKKNEAKAIATIQAIVLDVKTGVIPFTSIATNEFLAKKGKKDFSNKELEIRATISAESNALKELSKDLATYFN